MDTISIIKSRVSIRKYKSKPVPKEVLEDIVDCGRFAPCGFNGQDWAFVVITDQYMRDQISEAARYGRFIKDAGACIAVFYKKEDELAVENACAATENMIIAARAYGLGTCWVNSYRKANSEDIKRILKCPDDYELVTLFAVGYADESKITAKKQLDEVIHWNGF